MVRRELPGGGTGAALAGSHDGRSSSSVTSRLRSLRAAIEADLALTVYNRETIRDI